MSSWAVPTQRAPVLSAAALANAVVVGRSPMANMLSTSRGCPRGWIAEVAEVIGGAGPTPWRVWRTPARGVSPAGADMGEVRRWWCQVRTSALVTLGVGWGLLRAGYRLRPGAVAVAGSVARGGRRGARPKYLSGPVRAWAPGLTWRRLSRRAARSCSWTRTLRGVPKTGPRARDSAGSTLRSSGRAMPGGCSRRSGDWRPTMTGPPGKAVAPPGPAGGKGDN